MNELAELVGMARDGDENAYHAIMERFADMALGYAFSIVGDRDLAEDARQEAFLNAYIDLVALREPAAFPGWFRTVVRKHSVQLIRKRGRLTVPIDNVPEVEDGGEGPDRTFETRQTSEMVQDAIDRLPPNEAEVVRLHYLEDLSLEQVGERLGIEPKTVKSRLHTARSHLRLRLGRLARDKMVAQPPKGDPTVLLEASEEAIELFRRRRDHLLHVPGEEDVRRAGDMICAEGRLLRFMGRMQEALDCFQNGLRTPGLKRDAVYRARFRAEIGLTRLQTGGYEAARTELKAARTGLQRSKSEPEGLIGKCLDATIHNALGMCDWGQGRFAGARRWYERALDAAQCNECVELRPQVRNNLALLDWKSGDLHGARRQLTEALKEWKRAKDRFGEVLTAMNLGIIEENLGQAAAARRRYNRALNLARKIGFAQAEGATLANLANLELTAGAFDRALEYADGAARVATDAGDRRSRAIALENIGLAHLGLGDAEARDKAWDEATKLARAVGDAERLVSLALCRAQACLDADDATGATRRLSGVSEDVEKGGFRELKPWLLDMQGRVAVMRGDVEEARTYLSSAVDEATRQRRNGEVRRIRAVARDLGLTLPGAKPATRSKAKKQSR